MRKMFLAAALAASVCVPVYANFNDSKFTNLNKNSLSFI